MILFHLIYLFKILLNIFAFLFFFNPNLMNKMRFDYIKGRNSLKV